VATLSLAVLRPSVGVGPDVALGRRSTPGLGPNKAVRSWSSHTRPPIASPMSFQQPPRAVGSVA